MVVVAAITELTPLAPGTGVEVEPAPPAPTVIGKLPGPVNTILFAGVEYPSSGLAV
jgi:hypothetical protein